MPDRGVDTANPTVEAIRQWLTERVAFYLERPEESIDPDAGLVEMGLDSVYAMTLSGDLEDHFGLVIEPTVAWDYRTVNELTGFVREKLKGR